MNHEHQHPPELMPRRSCEVIKSEKCRYPIVLGAPEPQTERACVSRNGASCSPIAGSLNRRVHIPQNTIHKSTTMRREVRICKTKDIYLGPLDCVPVSRVEFDERLRRSAREKLAAEDCHNMYQSPSKPPLASCFLLHRDYASHAVKEILLRRHW